MLSRALGRTMLGMRRSSVLQSIHNHSRLFSSAFPIRYISESSIGEHDPPTISTAGDPFPSHGSEFGPLLSRNVRLSDTLLDDSIQALLPLLSAQGPHYITALIHAQPYLLMAGDTLRLPFRMPGVVPGDILRLNRASNIGSRDLTLKGMPYIDERLFECRARVIGVEAEPMRVKEKTKRRQRRVKTVRSKHRFTILKISELKINLVEDIETS
ncbi:hypothetical protein FGG08_006081 [Glutinoglossum americanum]|uniref:Large ribosomal subunit protein bL21m n=1 Tax=Glutinoglossum americanum TaxID=1670608 RepID=A0A9P8HX23_9PEZI|nr:hypothetical protein FGG08_006081 [Glutinoglossum americanum]